VAAGGAPSGGGQGAGSTGTAVGGAGGGGGGAVPPAGTPGGGTAAGGGPIVIPPGVTNGAVAAQGPAAVAQAIQQTTTNSIQAAVANGSLSPQAAQQAMAYQQNLQAQWQQILLDQGGGNPQTNPQWPQIQALIAKQVNQRITQLGGHA
jgi:hypothetical protein